jgi:signal transduction histidine kinase/ActR/RegA family two-component response regulator
MTHRSKELHGEAGDIQRVAEIAPDPLAITTLAGDFVWGNRAMCEALAGDPNEQLVGSLIDYIHPEDLQSIKRVFDAVSDGTAAHNRNLRFRTASQEFREWEVSIVPEASRLNVSCRDVTERMAQQREMLRRMELLKLAEQHAALGHWRVDLVTDEIYWSPITFEIYGQDPETFSPTLSSAFESYHPDDREMVSEHVRSAIETGAGYEFRARGVRPDKTVVHVLSRAEVETDSEGRPNSLFGIFQNITSQLRDARRAEQANRLASLGTFASGIAHEVNNPLAFTSANLDYILGVLEEVRSESDDATFDEVIEACRDAQQGAARVAMIIERLRTFSDAETAEVQDVELQEIITGCVAEFGANNPGVIAWEPEPGPAFVAGAGIALTTVFEELLDNALVAVAGCDAPRVSISLERSNMGYTVTVTDNGIGVEEGELEHIFDPFYTSREVDEGRGLGLSTCLGIVNSLGGSIDITSTPGSGTTVTVRLDAAGARQEVLATDSAAEAGSVSRLFVVDDEPLVGRAISRLLGREYDVTIFTSATASLEAIEMNGPPDAILSDVTMPGISGLEFYRNVVGTYPEMRGRFAFLTGGSIGSSIEEVISEASALRVIKPFSSDDLRNVIGQMVDSDSAK